MMPAPEPSRRPKLIGAAVLVATLVAGALAGAAADRLLTQRAALAEGRPADPCAGRPSHGPPFFFETLKLTPEQRAQVEGILERRRGQMDGLWQEARPQMRALIDSTESEIERILTPEQRVEFDRLREEKRKLHAKERHGWSPPPAVEGRGSRPPPPGSGPPP